MTPSPIPGPSAPKRFLPRIPDWAFSLGLVGSIVFLLIAIGWTPDGENFTEPYVMEESGAAPVRNGSYTLLADARPEEEPPPVTTIAVEEFGYGVTADDRLVGWGAEIRNTHDEYAAFFSLRVTPTGSGLPEQKEYWSLSAVPTAPGLQVVTGGWLIVGGDASSDVTVEIEVIDVQWFVFEGQDPPVPQEPALSSRIDAVETGSGDDNPVFSLTFTNDSAYALDPYLYAIFYTADGSIIGGDSIGLVSPLPPGESTRAVRIGDEYIPAEADLSLTEFVPAW